MNRIYGTYYIADYEHSGDRDRAERYLRSLGCKVEGFAMDYDAGASLTFSFPENKFKEIYNKLFDSASFSADINDYVKNDDGNYVSKRMYDTLKKQQKVKPIIQGYEKNVPVEVFFEVRNREGKDAGVIIDDITELLGLTAEIIAKTKEIVDGNTFVRVLYNMDLDDVNACENVGDYSLGNKDSSYFKSNKIYGECRPISPLFRWACPIGKDRYQLFRDKVFDEMNRDDI